MDNIVEIAANISTPIGLGGLFAAIFFLVIKQLIKTNLFSRLTREHSSEVIKIIVDRLFILSLVAMVLGFAGYVVAKVVPTETQYGNNHGVLRSQEVARSLQRELAFRIDQVNEVLQDAKSKARSCLNEIDTKGTVNGSCVRDYLNAAQKITVVFELGGIYRLPGKDEDTVWISSSGYGLRHLPERQGYKQQKYANSALKEIVEDYWRNVGTGERIDMSAVEYGLRELKAQAQFSNIEILEDWFRRHQAVGEYRSKYGGAYKVFNIEMDDYSYEIKKVYGWIESVISIWESFQSQDEISKMSS